jgi:cytochrome b561
MTLFGTKFRFGPVTQTFHWVMAVLVIAALSSALAADRGGAAILTLHETLGVTIFVMAALRLTWRAFDRLPGKPPMRNALARWSWWIDMLLYVLLFAVPITGIIGSHEMSAIAKGLLHPAPSVLGLHRGLALLLFLTAGLHSAFALFHHYVKKDGVLKMMLPGGRAA